MDPIETKVKQLQELSKQQMNVNNIAKDIADILGNADINEKKEIADRVGKTNIETVQQKRNLQFIVPHVVKELYEYDGRQNDLNEVIRKKEEDIAKKKEELARVSTAEDNAGDNIDDATNEAEEEKKEGRIKKQGKNIKNKWNKNKEEEEDDDDKKKEGRITRQGNKFKEKNGKIKENLKNIGNKLKNKKDEIQEYRKNNRDRKAQEKLEKSEKVLDAKIKQLEAMIDDTLTNQEKTIKAELIMQANDLIAKANYTNDELEKKINQIDKLINLIEKRIKQEKKDKEDKEKEMKKEESKKKSTEKEPVIEPVVSVVEPVIETEEPVIPVVEPVIETVIPVNEPVIETVIPLNEPVDDKKKNKRSRKNIFGTPKTKTEPVTETGTPAVETVEPTIPVIEPVEPVIEPVIKIGTPVTEPIEPFVPVIGTVEPIIETETPAVEPVDDQKKKKGSRRNIFQSSSKRKLNKAVKILEKNQKEQQKIIDMLNDDTEVTESNTEVDKANNELPQTMKDILDKISHKEYLKLKTVSASMLDYIEEKRTDIFEEFYRYDDKRDIQLNKGYIYYTKELDNFAIRRTIGKRFNDILPDIKKKKGEKSKNKNKSWEKEKINLDSLDEGDQLYDNEGNELGSFVRYSKSERNNDTVIYTDKENQEQERYVYGTLTKMPAEVRENASGLVMEIGEKVCNRDGERLGTIIGFFRSLEGEQLTMYEDDEGNVDYMESDAMGKLIEQDNYTNFYGTNIRIGEELFLPFNSESIGIAKKFVDVGTKVHVVYQDQKNRTDNKDIDFIRTAEMEIVGIKNTINTLQYIFDKNPQSLSDLSYEANNGTIEIHEDNKDEAIKFFAETYHKAKGSGTKPEFVEEMENILKTKEMIEKYGIPCAPEEEKNQLSHNIYEFTDKRGITFKLGDEVIYIEGNKREYYGKITGFCGGKSFGKNCFIFTEKKNSLENKEPISISHFEPVIPVIEAGKNKSEADEEIKVDNNNIEDDNSTEVTESNTKEVDELNDDLAQTMKDTLDKISHKEYLKLKFVSKEMVDYIKEKRDDIYDECYVYNNGFTSTRKGYKYVDKSSDNFAVKKTMGKRFSDFMPKIGKKEKEKSGNKNKLQEENHEAIRNSIKIGETVIGEMQINSLENLVNLKYTFPEKKDVDAWKNSNKNKETFDNRMDSLKGIREEYGIKEVFENGTKIEFENMVNEILEGKFIPSESKEKGYRAHQLEDGALADRIEKNTQQIRSNFNSDKEYVESRKEKRDLIISEYKEGNTWQEVLKKVFRFTDAGVKDEKNREYEKKWHDIKDEDLK